MLKDLVKNFKPSSTLLIKETSIKFEEQAKKSGFEMGDYITEFKTENSNRPSKRVIYPIAMLFLIIFGYLNYRRKE